MTTDRGMCVYWRHAAAAAGPSERTEEDRTIIQSSSSLHKNPPKFIIWTIFGLENCRSIWPLTLEVSRERTSIILQRSPMKVT